MDKYNILNKVFSKNTLINILNKSTDDTYVEAVKRFSLDEDKTNKELISLIYKIISKDYRNEYFYKNTLLNKLIINKHKVLTTKVLTEFPIGKSIADFITLNGKGIIYEIKTDLDNLERLDNQILDYYKCFPYVNIVTSENHLGRVLTLYNDTPLGIYYLTKRCAIKEIKAPEKYMNNIDPTIMFKALRKKEFENIILEYKGKLPNTSQFLYYSECLNLFKTIDVEILYNAIVKQLKNRCSIVVDKYSNVPEELKMAVYQLGLKSNQYEKLTNFLESKFYEMKLM